jgi:hypothetical protein
MFQTKEYEYLYKYYCNKIDQRPVDYNYTINASNYESCRLNISESSDWVCHWADIQYIPSKNKVPSWFARKMTEYFFGCKWKRK